MTDCYFDGTYGSCILCDMRIEYLLVLWMMGGCREVS